AIATARYARQLINEGAIGNIVSAQMRGKEDHRGGGEDLMVLGTHAMDLLRYLLGRNPMWVFATVTMDDGRAVMLGEAVDGPEELGLIAGDRIHALYGFGNGVTATFESRRNQEDANRFGLQIFGTRGIMTVYNLSQDIHIYEAPYWRPDRTVLVRDVCLEAEKNAPSAHSFQSPQMEGNAIIVREILQAREEGRRPISSGHDGRWALEMIHGIYASHMEGGRVNLPLVNRDHPLSNYD
ncbi:MAG: hypothetical protein HOH43_09200, partial [Candidatus Latescibacteria bacterium]|nr:hypothetical protein [Candidatus Latescibacterota bacterium]